MAKLMLPYYENFFNIIESGEISKWEAKTFICQILDEYTATTARKQKVYHGINILVRCGYLIREKNNKNQRTYLYSETIKSKNYRESIIKRKMENILDKKLSDILEDIENKNLELIYMVKLVEEHPIIENSLGEFLNKERESLQQLLVHKNLLSKLINEFKPQG